MVIEVTAEVRQELATLFGVSPQYVGMALRNEREGGKAPLIREAARKKGGELYEKKKIEMPQEIIKVLNAKGEVERVVMQ